MNDFDFVKMQGAGNDFVVLDALARPLEDGPDFAEVARIVCNRHYGIGGDGLLLLEGTDAPTAQAGVQVRMRMWNPDGSEDMCGNGLRCVAALAHERAHVSGARFTIATLAGPREVTILEPGLVRAAMGRPSFAPADIPMHWPAERGPRAVEYSLDVGGARLQHVTTLSTGTAHTVIFVEAPPDEAEFQRLSPLIEEHLWFPERTSIMWAQVVGRDRLKLRIWERGAGETLACGTGACAAAVAAQVTGRCGSEVEIESRGGVLQVQWQPEGEMFLSGPARVVFEGTY